MLETMIIKLKDLKQPQKKKIVHKCFKFQEQIQLLTRIDDFLIIKSKLMMRKFKIEQG
jgi:hypothetical protein